METVLMYLLKMSICSAVLYVYYRVALYNERFHQWNRFYLLAAMLLSVVVPLLSIPVMADTSESELASVVASLPWNAGVNTAVKTSFTWQDVALALATLISMIFFIRIILNLVKIVAAYRSNPVSSLQHNVQLIITQLTQAPFSFFSWLFWRNDIDPASANGQRMLNHELTHIREHHSIDKLFTSLLLCVFWMNPFFWLMRRELSMIHEFLADRKAIRPQDGAAFAEMILQALPLKPAASYGLVNPFFSSQIKRRLLMITTSKDPKYNYLRRICGLAVMISSVFALALSIQQAEAQKPVTKVVIKRAPDDLKAYDTIRTKSSNKMIIRSSDNSVYVVADTVFFQDKKDGKVTIVGSGKVKQDDKNDRGNVVSFRMDTDKLTLFPEKNAPIYILDGAEITSAEMDKVDGNSIKELSVLKDAAAATLYGERAKNGVILITSKTAEEQKENSGTSIINQKIGEGGIVELKSHLKTVPMFYVNGNAITEAEMKALKPNDIESVNVLRGESAIKKYGDKGKDGVVEITMKKPIT
jgi:TonB-dependent SusC/RagA subfamily outer membrane receptor